MFSNTMKLLGDRFRSAVGSSFGDDCPFDEQWIKPCNDPRFGDYQFNAALPLAKSLQKKPATSPRRWPAVLNSQTSPRRLKSQAPDFSTSA
ncbi:MAG: hypothetical protein R3E58_10550 [Phycisphaerae bacterium]